MDEIENKFGVFFIDGQEFKGKITNNKNNLFLELNIDFSKKSEFNFENKEFIYGKINNIPITLYQCFLFDDVLEVSFVINYLFKNLRKEDCFKFNNIYVKYNHFDEWVLRSGISRGKVDFNNNSYNLNFSLLPNITVNLGDFDICIDQFWGTKNKLNEFVFYDSNIVKFEFKDYLSFQDILSKVHILDKFLSLAINHDCGINKLFIEIDDGNIDIYSSEILKSSAEKYSRIHFLFTYNDIEKEFESVLNTFFSKYNDFLNFINLYHINLKIDTYGEALFIAYTQALETYMRENPNLNDIYLSEEEYIVIIQPMYDCLNELDIDKSHKQSLKNRIKYGFEYSLRKRLNELFDFLKDLKIINCLEKDFPNFSSVVVDTRNYYTHYSEELKDVALKNKELFNLNQDLKILIEVCLLKEIGFSNELIDKVMVDKFNHKDKLL